MLADASWILRAGIQHHRANDLKRSSAEDTRDVAVVCIVTAAFPPAVFGVFAHGVFSLRTVYQN